MTDTNLLYFCLILLIVNVIFLLILIKRSQQKTSDRDFEKLSEKTEKIYSASQYNANEIKNLTNLTEYRLSSMQKAMADDLYKISENNKKMLDEIRLSVNEKLSETLESRLSQSYKIVNDRLTEVAKSIGEVQALAENVSDIKKVFYNVKLRGTWGEMQLNSILSDMLAPNEYASSVKINPLSDEMVDFAVFLPDKNGDTVLLPIDSKFPLEEYSRLVEAQACSDPQAEEKARNKLYHAVKLQAESIAKKYILPPKTTDFAVLYLPSESLYAEVIKCAEIGDFLNSRRILVCGPTNLSAFLSTLQTGFKVALIEKQSQELWKLLAVFKSDFRKFAEALEKTKKKLEEAQNSVELASSRTQIIQKNLKAVDDACDPILLEEGETID